MMRSVEASDCAGGCIQLAVTRLLTLEVPRTVRTGPLHDHSALHSRQQHEYTHKSRRLRFESLGRDPLSLVTLYSFHH